MNYLRMNARPKQQEGTPTQKYMVLKSLQADPTGAGKGRETLLRATMKGVLRILSRLMDSMVCCSMPCMMSTTRMAMSHSPEPRERRFVNDS